MRRKPDATPEREREGGVAHRLLHLAVVETAAGGASLYGRSIQGHHVAALVKHLASSDQLSIDIKCGTSVIANGLLAELSAYF